MGSHSSLWQTTALESIAWAAGLSLIAQVQVCEEF